MNKIPIQSRKPGPIELKYAAKPKHVMDIAFVKLPGRVVE